MIEIKYDINQIEHLHASIKEQIMYFFNHVVCDEVGASTMPIIDKKTGESVQNYHIQDRVVARALYIKGTYRWWSDMVYHFDKYDIKLDPDFVSFILSWSKIENQF